MRNTVRKVCVVTGARADYGLLKPVMLQIQRSSSLALQLIVTGMHLSPEFGFTVKAIEEDGFPVSERLEMLLSSDSRVGVGKSVGVGVMGFAECLGRLSPDILLVLGDRYETFAAALAATLLGIPIAHIAGGDVTEGAFDEALRHGISKMAHLHFPTNDMAARRLRQMGESGARIWQFGSPGIDSILETRLLGRSEIESRLGISLGARNILVTFHAATLESDPAGRQFAEVLAGLEALGPGYSAWFTMPNADPQGRALKQMVIDFTRRHPASSAFESLGGQMYLSLLGVVDVVVGNSSSGLYEAPTMGTPTVNVGSRQKGRPRASSVVDCESRAEDVRGAIICALSLGKGPFKNPFGDGGCAGKLVGILESIEHPQALLIKQFEDLNWTT